LDSPYYFDSNGFQVLSYIQTFSNFCFYFFDFKRRALVRLIGVTIAIVFWGAQIITTAAIIKDHPGSETTEGYIYQLFSCTYSQNFFLIIKFTIEIGSD
jgi:hypothetical protein